MTESVMISNRYRWAIVTGFGFRWTRYHLNGNYHFAKVDDHTEIVSGAEGLKYKKSKIGITTINMPLLFEWQHPSEKLFFSVGVVGSVKTWSYSRIEFFDENSRNPNKKHKKKLERAMTLRPLTMDFRAQVGTKDFGIYARYSPFSIFQNNKGPELYPLSFGFMLYTN